MHTEYYYLLHPQGKYIFINKLGKISLYTEDDMRGSFVLDFNADYVISMESFINTWWGWAGYKFEIINK